ncbi:hypothetical protein ABW19_dt0210022 [Dactylella cylindrospora]|nr:hypothetical protein ABW19_dt0210022 [Dactylella cylindrospora]
MQCRDIYHGEKLLSTNSRNTSGEVIKGSVALNLGSKVSLKGEHATLLYSSKPQETEAELWRRILRRSFFDTIWEDSKFPRIARTKFGFNLCLLFLLAFHLIVFGDVCKRLYRTPLDEEESYSQLGSLLTAIHIYEVTDLITLLLLFATCGALGLARRIESDRYHFTPRLDREYFLYIALLLGSLAKKCLFNGYNRIFSTATTNFALPPESSFDIANLSKVLRGIISNLRRLSEKDLGPKPHLLDFYVGGIYNGEENWPLKFALALSILAPMAMLSLFLCKESARDADMAVAMEKYRSQEREFQLKGVISKIHCKLAAISRPFAMFIPVISISDTYDILYMATISVSALTTLLGGSLRVIPEAPGRVYDMDQFFAVTGGLLVVVYSCYSAYKGLSDEDKKRISHWWYIWRRDFRSRRRVARFED